MNIETGIVCLDLPFITIMWEALQRLWFSTNRGTSDNAHSIARDVHVARHRPIHMQ